MKSIIFFIVLFVFVPISYAYKISDNLTVIGSVKAKNYYSDKLPNAQVGTTYTFQLSDANSVVTADNSNPTLYTIPDNESVNFKINDIIDILQLGTGKVTFVGATNVVINSYLGYLSIAGRYAGVSLLKTGNNTWLLTGALIP